MMASRVVVPGRMVLARSARRSTLQKIRSFGGHQADAAFVAVADRLVLDRVVDVLHVAAPIFAERVDKSAGEHDGELDAGVPVHRQRTAGSKLDEVELALRARREREAMLPTACSEALPRNLGEGEAVAGWDRRWERVRHAGAIVAGALDEDRRGRRDRCRDLTAGRGRRTKERGSNELHVAQLVAACRANRDVHRARRGERLGQGAGGEAHQRGAVRMVANRSAHLRSSSAARTFWYARRRRDLTVPSGSDSRAEMSWWDRPSTKAAVTTARWSSGSAASTA